jgi:hypothetical protein
VGAAEEEGEGLFSLRRNLFAGITDTGKEFRIPLEL